MLHVQLRAGSVGALARPRVLVVSAMLLLCAALVVEMVVDAAAEGARSLASYRNN